MDSKVSVIIPAYNAQSTIEAAIRSVTELQGYRNLEVLVVDDASKDDTAGVVQRMQQADPRIVPLRNARAKGASGARNTGLLRADGEYVAFLDADDLWQAGHLSRGVGFLQRRTDVGAVCFNFDVFDVATKTTLPDWFSLRSAPRSLASESIGDGFWLITADVFEALIREMFTHLQAMIVRRRACEGLTFNEGVRVAEDRDFAIQLVVKAGVRFAWADVSTGTYFRHPNSLTSTDDENRLRTLNDEITLFRHYLEHYASNGSHAALLKRELHARHVKRAFWLRKRGDLSHAWNAVRESAQYRWSLAQGRELAKILAASVGVRGRTA